jgi:hypothetical protein
LTVKRQVEPTNPNLGVQLGAVFAIDKTQEDPGGPRNYLS